MKTGKCKIAVCFYALLGCGLIAYVGYTISEPTDWEINRASPLEYDLNNDRVPNIDASRLP